MIRIGCLVTVAALAVASAPGGAPAGESAGRPPILGPGERGAVIEALARLHLTPGDLEFDRDPVNGPSGIADPWRVPLAEQALRAPLHVPDLSQGVAEAALQAGGDAGEQVRAAARALGLADPPEGWIPRSDVPLSTDLEIPPAPVPPGRAGRTLLKQWTHLAPALRAELVEDVRALHALRREARAALGALAATPEAWGSFRERALEALDPQADQEGGEAAERERALALARASDAVDAGRLAAVAAGAAALARRIVAVAGSLPPGSWPTEPLDLDTPAGRIVVGTPRADLFQGEAALILDPGGDDRYLLAGARQPGEVQLLLDLSGHDAWRSAFPGALGGAIGGVSLLIDAEGDDVYDGARISLGAAVLGVGVLIDQGGSDSFRGLALTQGAGLLGAGVLVDAATGSDIYHAGVYGQGVGLTLGYGSLVELGGDDVYSAGGVYRDSPSRFPDHTLSLSQGFAMGMRPYAGGGVGVLADRGGNDSYGADLFAQGCSYWFGLGVLYDVAGDDHYRAWQYGQGSGIHLSTGLLADLDGDDQYVIENLGQGSSHDLAVGWLVDRAGDDLYQGSSTVQGGALTNAVTFFVDVAGNDTYSARSLATSRGGGDLRRRMGAVGVFLDVQGEDVYNETDHSGLRRPMGEGKWYRPWAYGISVDRAEAPDPATGLVIHLPPIPPGPVGPRVALPEPGPVPAAAAEVALANNWSRSAADAQAQVATLAARGPAYLPDLLALLPREHLLEQYTVERVVQAIRDGGGAESREATWKHLRAHLQGAAEYEGVRWPMRWIAELGLNPEDTVGALASRAGSSRDRVRASVAEALGVLSSPLGAPVLLGLLADPDDAVRANAAWALGRTGGRGALAALAQAIQDRSFLVRFGAAAALVERAAAGEQRPAQAQVRAAARLATDPWITGLAEDLLSALERPADEGVRRFWGLDPRPAAVPPATPPTAEPERPPPRPSRRERGR